MEEGKEAEKKRSEFEEDPARRNLHLRHIELRSDLHFNGIDLGSIPQVLKIHISRQISIISISF